MSDPQTLLLFGATSDVVERLLLPGLGSLLASEKDRRVDVIGVGRQEVTDDAWAGLVRDALVDGGASAARAAQVDTRYEMLDTADDEAARAFAEGLPTGTVLFFSLPPSVTVDLVETLAEADLPQVRLALEKPFGHDLDSARRLNAVLSAWDEQAVFRVDHFLGDGAVLGLLGLRFANPLFAAVWDADHIESVEIVFDEALALEGRAGYYDDAGALVDMIQSHLLLLLALVAMERPARLDPAEVHEAMARTLRATRLRGEPATASRRARYTAGRAGGVDVPDYTSEEGVDPSKETETFAELDLEVGHERWAGVGFTLRSGKAIGRERQQIIVTLRPASPPDGFSSSAPGNRIVIDLDPQRVQVELATNGAGDPTRFEGTRLASEVGAPTLEPYGQVLAEILDGRSLLSVRGDIAEECWRIVTPVLRAWQAGEVPLRSYPAGSDGPT